MSSSISIRAKKISSIAIRSIVVGSILSLVTFVPSINAATSGLPVFGESGPTVLRLQEALISRGFSLKGGPNGVFSSTTRSTLKTFQKVVGFKATGALDEPTAKFLGLVAPAQIDPKTLPAIGSTGDAVWSLQQALINNNILLKGGADGIYGIATTIAVTKFQSARSLPITKVLDNATALALGLTPGPTSVVKPVAIKPVAKPSAVIAPAAAIAPAAIIAPVVTSALVMLTIDTLPTRGQRSDAVRLVQEKLLLNGIEVKGGADGIFGVATSISLAAFQTSRGLNVTSAADMPTAIALGVLPDLATLGIPKISVFPTQGRCSFIDSWGWPRSGGRLHEGVDIMGAKGLAIYAVLDGTITKMYGADSSLSGNAIRLTTADNTYFFYAHMDSIAPGISVGTAVRAGQIIGYMGSTGNVGSSHLHFEVHPGGGAAVSPYPVVKAVDACNVTDVLPQP
ncbi:MAG: peptidoglycan-binding protein [Acidimicrobiaceae bacterium]|nr:peptidoglycan-binding protein [Acidimicrobiaceae bacterium]